MELFSEMFKTREIVLHHFDNPLSDNDFLDERTNNLRLLVADRTNDATSKISNLGNLTKLKNVENIYIVDRDFIFSAERNRYVDYHKKTLRLPDNIANLSKIQRIHIHGFRDVVIPKSIGELANLQELWIEEFQTLKIPKSITNLKQLKTLKIEGTWASNVNLPSQIGQLANLEMLTLEKTNIRRLPESITDLSKLKVLKLKNNHYFKNLPEDIGRLQSLTQLEFYAGLSMSMGKLRFGLKIPQSIVELTNLRRLVLPCSYITRLPSKEAIQTIQNEQVRNELMECHEGLEERQQKDKEFAKRKIGYFMMDEVQPRIQRMSRKRITPKHVKKSLKFSEKKYGKKESNRMVNESFGDVVFEKFPREMERDEFRRRQKPWTFNRSVAQKLLNGENLSSSSPEMTPDDEEERREHWATIEANKQNYDLSKPWNSPAAEDAMDVVESNTNSPASAAASKRERSSSEPGVWPVGQNDNDNRPQKQSRKHAWGKEASKGGKRTKHRNRK